MATSVPSAIGYLPGVAVGGGANPCHLASGADDLPDLPHGWPRSFDGDLAWTGQLFQDSSRYIQLLSKADIAEIEAAVVHFKSLGLDGCQVSRDNFPLPTLGPKLSKLSHDIHYGKGFAVVRGLTPQEYSVEDISIVWLGVQGYIANRHGRQDKTGNMMVHIHADSSSNLKVEHHRHSTSAITFHNEEAGDIIGWLTKSTAAAGGKCIIASAYTVYNELSATRPDLIRILARADWPFALPRFQRRPVIYFYNGRLIMNFGRTPLLGNAAHPRTKQLPSLTAGQLEALDAIETIAKATQIEIQTQPGDMHFINNLAVLHRREAFVNGKAPGETRHLVRMRLRNDELGWPLPPGLIQEWFDAFDKKGDRVWHLEPMPGGFFPLRCNPN